MAEHSISKVHRLENQLDNRLEALKAVMRGREITDEQDKLRLDKPDDFRRVNAEDLNVAVDDFKTILASVKRTLK